MADRVRHVRLPSQGALGEVEGELDLLYVDGAHRYGPARDDLRDWGARVRPGGALLVHDCFSSVGVTLAIGRLFLVGERLSLRRPQRLARGVPPRAPRHPWPRAATQRASSPSCRGSCATWR